MKIIVDPAKQQTRLPAILRAALSLFVDKGIEAATTKDIAKRARVSEGALYRHFKSKEELAWYLFSTNLAQFSQKVLAEVEATREIKGKLRAVVDGCFSAFEEDRELFTYLILSEHREFKRYSQNAVHAGIVVSGVVKAGQKLGEIRKGEESLLTAMVLGTIIRTCLFKMYGRVKDDLRGRSDEVTDALWRALRD